MIGRSLGSAPAIYLASQRHIAALVLISPFYSIKSVARSMGGYLAYLLPDIFKNYEHIPKVSCPLMTLHGDLDQLITTNDVRRLNDLCVDSNQKSIVVRPEMTHTEFSI